MRLINVEHVLVLDEVKLFEVVVESLKCGEETCTVDFIHFDEAVADDISGSRASREESHLTKRTAFFQAREMHSRILAIADIDFAFL
jgi:hypothetical protein